MMMNKVFQGHIALDGTTRITCTTTSLVISSIIINNLTNNYFITVNRFIQGPGIHNVTLFEFDLDAGDTVRDLEEYLLETGDYLELITDVIGTSYSISGTET